MQGAGQGARSSQELFGVFTMHETNIASLVGIEKKEVNWRGEEELCQECWILNEERMLG